MLANNDIQASLVAKLKASPTLVTQLASSGEIKEDQWQGTTFVYPAVRVDIQEQIPPAGNECLYAYVNLSVLVFTEDASSQNCDKIADVVNDLLHAKSFTQGNVKWIKILSRGLNAAIRMDRNTWVSEVKLRGLIQSA